MKEKTETVMWCAECDRWFRIDAERFRNVCPKCGRYLRVWRCNRCGHTWVPRRVDRPAKVCPSCHSMYWNKTRVRRVRDER